MVIDDINGVKPKKCHKRFGRVRSHSTDEPAAQVLLHARRGGRFAQLIAFDAKLWPVLAMRLPIAGEGKRFTGNGIQQGTHHRHRVAVKGAKTGDGIPVLFIVEGNDFQAAFQTRQILAHVGIGCGSIEQATGLEGWV